MLKETVECCKPTRATKYSAMVDLYAKEDVVIGAGETKIVNLGVKIDLEKVKEIKDCQGVYVGDKRLESCFNEDYFNEFMSTHFIELHPRSSLRAKGLIVGVGVIDLDYPDEFGLIVHYSMDIKSVYALNENSFPNEYHIYKGDKIAQCTLMEHKGFLMGIESEAERKGGFGSSGL